jgi:hypothetical protein
MSDPYGSSESKLRQAAELIQGGHKDEARQLLRDILVADPNNLPAWELLSYATHNIKEETYCMERILALRPDHGRARQRLAEIRSGLPAAGTPAQEQVRPAQAETPPNKPLPTPPPVRKAKKRKRKMAPILLSATIFVELVALGLVIYFFGILPSNTSGQGTQTVAAGNDVRCEEIIARALELAGEACNSMDSNNVCYGNQTLLAELLPEASQRFSERGDMVGIDDLRRLSVSPLDLDTQEWGIAILKVMANLPRSLPGETVTLMVFGNTTLENDSEHLESFYFSSGFGEIICEEVPSDGLLISMPDGTGIQFTINSAELLLMGNASLSAIQNGGMDIKLYSGSAQLTSMGVSQTFSAGESVSVTLGGENGMEAISVPSEPVPLAPEDLEIACTMMGAYCTDEEIIPLADEAAQLTLQAALADTPTPAQSLTPSMTPTITLTGTITSTPSRTGTPTRTPTITRTGTITRTPSRTGSPTLTLIPSRTPTISSTPTITRTPTLTYTRTNTLQWTNTSPPPTATTGCSVSAGNLDAGDDYLALSLTNNGGSAVTISGIGVSWEDPTGDQVMLEMRLGIRQITNVDDEDSPSLVPGEIPFFGNASARTIPTGTSKTLWVIFKYDLEATGGYSVSVSFGSGCDVEASR